MISPTLPTRMTAWTQHVYGTAETLAQEDIDVPSPGEGEVLLRVRATGLNSADVRIMRGEPYIARIAFGLARPRQIVRGKDVAGTVVAVGPASPTARAPHDFVVGDEVVGELDGGGFAPYLVAPAQLLTRRPAEVTSEVAAAVPMAASTAQQALDLARVSRDQRVLIIGASGGVGTFAVQLAVRAGADVSALCGARAIDTVRDLGARHVWDYRVVQPGHPDLQVGSFDAVIDIAGTAPLRQLRALLRPGGSVVLVAGGTARVWGPVGRILAGAMMSIGSPRKIRALAARVDPKIVASVLELVARGTVAPLIERTWLHGEAREALAHVDAGHTLGKIVVVGPTVASDLTHGGDNEAPRDLA